MSGFMEPVMHVLGWGVTHIVWQAGLVAGLVWLMQRVGRGAPPHWRYRIGWWAFVSLPLMPVGMAVLLLTRSPVAMAPDSPVGAAVQVAGAETAAVPWWLDGLAGALPWLGLAWGVMIAVAAVRFAGGLVVARGLVRRGRQVSEGHRSAFQRAARRMGVRAELRVSGEVRVPTVLGIYRPTVLVPADLSTSDVNDLMPLLVHELAHVRRGDLFDNALQVLVRSVLSFHPAVRWVSTQIEVERERACDEMAAMFFADRRRYAVSLARLELTRATARPPALAVDGAPILDRVRRLAGPPATLSGTSRIRVAATAALGLGLLVAGACTGMATGAQATYAAMHRAPAAYTVQASDPAGKFTISIQDGRAVAATLNGHPLHAGQLVQDRDAVTLIPDAPHEPFTVHVQRGGGIRWSPRAP